MPFTKGDSNINRRGRPQGSREFFTDFKEAVRRIKNKETGKELTEIDIIKTGIEKMYNGEAKFDVLFKDLLDRVYGKPQQKTDITTNGKDLPVPILGVELPEVEEDQEENE